MPAKFESSAKLWIQARLPGGSTNQESSSFYPLLYFYSGPLGTVTEIIRSSAVLESAASTVNKQLPPNRPAMAAWEIGKELNIKAVKDADVLVVSYKNRDPAVAHLVLDAILSRFQKLNSEQAAASATQSRQFLEQQIAGLRTKLDGAGKAIQSFEETYHLVSMDGDAAALVSQSSNLKTGISEATITLGQLQKKISFLESQLGIPAENAFSMQQIKEDKTLEKERESLAEAEIKWLDAKSRYDEDSPRCTRLLEAKQRIEESITERIRSLVGSAGAGLTIGQLTNVNQVELQTLMEAYVEQLFQKERLMMLNSKLPEIQAQLQKVPAQQLQLVELKRAQNVAADALSRAETELESAKLAETVSSAATNIKVIDSPSLPTQPDISDPLKIFAICVAVSAVLSGGLFALLWKGDPYIRKAKEVSKVLPLRIVGWLPEGPAASETDAVYPLDRLRFALHDWLMGDQTKSIVVISADEGDGKSTVASGLALSLAEHGTKVLLVDANSKSPSLHNSFGSQIVDGPAQRFSNKTDDPGHLVKEIRANLSLIPSGSFEQGDSELLATAAMKFGEFAQGRYDVIIYDTASVGESATALTLLSPTTSVLVVVRLGHSERQSLCILAGQIQGIFDRCLTVITDAVAADYAAAQELQLRTVSSEPVANW
jgi:uncharacterized protein involved in exopolysaccharide biosynthesis/cellulose biosynthesis protein BcsQ